MLHKCSKISDSSYNPILVSTSYKRTDRRFKVLEEGDLVMVHLNKAKLPQGAGNKLLDKKFGHVCIVKKIGDNVLDLPPES